MDAKISVLVICVEARILESFEAIMYLLLRICMTVPLRTPILKNI